MIEGDKPSFLLVNDGNSSLYYSQIHRYSIGSVIEAYEIEPFTALLTNLTYKPTSMDYNFQEQILFACAGQTGSNDTNINAGSIMAHKLKIKDDNVTVNKDPYHMYVFRPNHTKSK